MTTNGMRSRLNCFPSSGGYRIVGSSCHRPAPPSPRLQAHSLPLSRAHRIFQCRLLSTGDRDEVKHVAILGGGITGLTTAHYITEEFPQAKVTIFEGQQRLGGWLRSKEVDVGDGNVIFESGPRSLRIPGANGLLMLQLIESLDLTSDVLVMPRSSPAAQNRFLYYPDSLVRLPGPGRVFDNVRTLLSEPVFEGFLQAIGNHIKTPRRSSDVVDESVGSFLRRRFDERLANNLCSALFHGIYAGDIWQLSAKSILTTLWEQEMRHDNLFEPLLDGWLKKQEWQFCDDLECKMSVQEAPMNEELQRKAINASIISFKKGLGQLTDKLEKQLRENGNVKIRKGEWVKEIKPRDGKLKIFPTFGGRDPKSHASPPTMASHVVSTIAPHALASLLQTGRGTVSFPQTLQQPAPAASVAVVNLYYPTPSLLTKLHPPRMHPRHLKPNGLQGFGYLIPASVPFSENPERALGVIFDSDITPQLYSTIPKEKQGTRLTVMLGGHWWDGWNELPSGPDCVDMARSVLQRHLGLQEEPVAVIPNVQRNCIPQYHVGHWTRMRSIHHALTSWGNSQGLDGRIRVAGSWYSGVGVNDCVRSAWEAVQGLKKNAAGKGWSPQTGLENFIQDSRPMALCGRQQKGMLHVLQLDERAKGGRFPRVEGLIGRK